jgi:hypothetical protein
VRLNQQEQQIILDFYFRCGSEEDIARGRDLIASNSEAARLYAGLEDTLTELDSIKYEPCPENLSDLTVARLKLAASASHVGQAQASAFSLEQLLEAENRKTAAAASGSSGATIQLKSKLLRNFFEFAATAAAIILISGIAFPTLSYMRQQNRQTACLYNMQSIGQGIGKLLNDNDNLAQANVAAGSPWWKIGDQSQQSQSNTRFAWQLVKRDYVKPDAFICPGHRNARPLTSEQITRQLQQLQDFPSRNNISYSFVIISNKTAVMQSGSRRVIMGDMNPVFRSIPTCGNDVFAKMNEFEKVLLTQNLKQMSSTNHNCKSQNVLYSDGSVEPIKDRMINGDDIFTIQGVDTYTGTESPASANDVFLVP